MSALTSPGLLRWLGLVLATLSVGAAVAWLVPRQAYLGLILGAAGLLLFQRVFFRLLGLRSNADERGPPDGQPGPADRDWRAWRG